ncbi:MAG: putative toxin-antitoxin system toxin component, PIN family [Candidatus Saccharimonadales bacterium]
MTSSTPSRVVIDSNVWISALVFGGTPRRVLESCVQAGARIVISEQLLTETRRIINVKFVDFADDFESLIVSLALFIDVVQLGSQTVTVCRDPVDNMIFETALAGRAQVIISGDKDLLVLKHYQTVRIVTPTDFVQH